MFAAPLKNKIQDLETAQLFLKLSDTQRVRNPDVFSMARKADPLAC